MFIPAANLPTGSEKLLELPIAAQCPIDKASAIRAFCWWQRLKVSDYACDGLQYGTLSSIMPTSEQAPNHNMSVVGLSCIYRWQ